MYASYGQIIRQAYADALGISREDMTEPIGLAAETALLVHASDDAEAAALLDIDQSEISHDRVTIHSADRLPLIIVGTTAGVPGRFYFTRPLAGWPRPGGSR